MRKVLLIASTPYTGSTLLSILLGSHPEIATISELTGLNPDIDETSYMCSCGSRLVECQFFDQVSRRVGELGADFSYSDFNTRFHTGGNRIVRNILYRSLFVNVLERVRGFFVSFSQKYRSNIDYWSHQNAVYIDAISEIRDSKLFLDASKDRCRIEYLSKLNNTELSIVHLVRDPRGYVNSARKNSGKSLFRASIEWRLQHREIERLISMAGAKCIRVKYEDICVAAKVELDRISNFCGIAEFNEIGFKPNELHLIGNRMRLKKDLSIKIDESWKSELSETRVRLIEFLCGSVMVKKYGYHASAQSE